MKNSGPNSPQTIRGLLSRRSLRGIMDTRWQQEADIVTAPMGNPFGKGFHELKTPSGTHYVVGDQTGGRTFAPDTEVMVAIPQGRHNKAVIGGAPANKKGGGARTRSSRRRGTVVLDANQYAFGTDGVDMHAMLYSDGTYVSTRATATEVGGYYTGCILSDSSLVVGDGSLLMHDGSTLRVWDVVNATFYSYSVPSGWTNASALYYQNGFLYWCEVEDIPTGSIGSGDTTFDYRLRTAATDLSGATTITTVTSALASSYGAPFTIYDLPPEPFAFAVDTDGAVLYLGVSVNEIINHEVLAWYGLQARFLLAGGAPTLRAWTIDEFRSGASTGAPAGGGFPCATIGTTSFAICCELSSGHSVLSKADNASAAAADLWPTTDFDAGVSPASFGVGTGGSVLQVYGGGYLLRGVSAGTEITNAVEAFDGTNYPTSMHYYGV